MQAAGKWNCSERHACVFREIGMLEQKILTEIRSVGLLDWLWFVVWLRRNVFSDRLRVVRYWPNRLDKLHRDRRRAAIIEAKLDRTHGR